MNDILSAFSNARWFNRRELARALKRPDNRLTTADLNALDALIADGVIVARRIPAIGHKKWEYRRVKE